MRSMSERSGEGPRPMARTSTGIPRHSARLCSVRMFPRSPGMFISSAYRCAIRSAGSLTLGMVRRVARPLVCIPTYNEASNILALIERVHEAAPEADVLVIDDASPDGTGDAVRAQILKDARLEIMARPAKLGLGTAYMAGFAYSLQHALTTVLTKDSA